MSNSESQSDEGVEVTVVFEPTRISNQILELAYEFALPIVRRRFRSARTPNEADQSEMRPRERAYRGEEVA